MTVDVMVEALTILAVATNETKRGAIQKVHDEVDGKEAHQGQLGEVGQIDARRGTEGICGAAEDDAVLMGR